MTTTGPKGEAAGRRTADPETLSGAAPLAEAVPGKGAPLAAQSGPPDDIQELRQEIEQTREQLGQTVEQLAARADLKAQAKSKAAELAGRVKGSAVQVRSKAAGWGARVRSQIAGKTMVARQRTAGASSTAKTQVQSWAAPVWEAAPEPARRAAAKGASTAKQRPVLLAVASATLIAGCLALLWWRRR